MQIEENIVVSVHYKGTITGSDEEFDSNIGEDPLVFLVGHKQMIPGFEANLLGKSKGSKVTFDLKPEDAYGERDDDAVIQIPIEQFGDLGLEEGMVLVADIGGGPAPFTVIAVADETATCGFNHALAGKSLTFEVEVADVREATEEELSHGHVHGPGGHHH
jgi:FKBP-type peptidyl-prolyl cis-trans isomerase SlyD